MTMTCTNRRVQELLPAYREQALEEAENLMIEQHLASCEDCRSELSLLRMMASEQVPDPGDAFWASMPGRVHRALEEQLSTRRRFSLMQLEELLTFPRWSLTAAALAIVLVLSWVVVRPSQNERLPLVSNQNEAIYEDSLSGDTVVVADLGSKELDSVDEWAGRELASIAQEAEPVLIRDQEGDFYEELAELDAQETARLSAMIEHYKQEV